MVTSFLVRLYNALMEARMRQAMRELALHGYSVPVDAVKPAELLPPTAVKPAASKTRVADAGMLPFVR